MAASFGWGALAASSLVIGSIVALLFRINLRTIGLIMGFGGGVLISAVAFDLVEEAAEKSVGTGWTAAGLFAGCLVFFFGDRMIDRLGGGDRKDPTGAEEEEGGGNPLSIVLGTVLDGIPESMVIGLTIYEGGAVGAAYLAAVFISNLPEATSSTAGLVTGHSRIRSRLRRRRDPHDARGHDDARGVRARGQARRGRHDARIRDRVHNPLARLSHRPPRGRWRALARSSTNGYAPIPTGRIARATPAAIETAELGSKARNESWLTSRTEAPMGTGLPGQTRCPMTAGCLRRFPELASGPGASSGRWRRRSSWSPHWPR